MGGGGSNKLLTDNDPTYTYNRNWTSPTPVRVPGPNDLPRQEYVQYPDGYTGTGVATGLPAGGMAREAINRYLNPIESEGTTISYVPQQQVPLLDRGGIQAVLDYNAANGISNDGSSGPSISNRTQAGRDKIDAIVQAGGINPETGDPWISAGPNALNSGDYGIFGYGNDYNQEFGENYDAQSAHAANNPTGQSTGTPLYEQGFVQPDGLVDTFVNNSLIGQVGSAITGENLLPTYDDLLPPAESFSNYNDNDGGVNNDGNPHNDTGNDGWGFTSIGDMFDGGGAGASGDSYTGGIHGNNTVGDTSVGVSSAITGKTNSDNDGDGSNDSNKILCCAYKNLGWLPREIWRLDQRYGVSLLRTDPELLQGYHMWAYGLADYVQKDTRMAVATRYILWPVVKAWALEMAHKQRPEKYNANYAGKVITVVGEAFSRLCYKFKGNANAKLTAN